MGSGPYQRFTEGEAGCLVSLGLGTVRGNMNTNSYPLNWDEKVKFLERHRK